MRLYLSAIVVVLFLLSGCAPSVEETLQTQVWVDAAGEDDPRVHYTEFRKDKVVTIHGARKDFEGTWEVLDKDISLTLQGDTRVARVLLILQPDGTYKSEKPKLHIAAWNGEVSPKFEKAGEYVGRWDPKGRTSSPVKWLELKEAGLARVQVASASGNATADANWRVKGDDDLNTIVVDVKGGMWHNAATHEFGVSLANSSELFFVTTEGAFKYYKVQ